MNEKELQELERITAQIDYLFQEGVIFSAKETVRLKACAEQLRALAYDITFQEAFYKANPRKGAKV